MIAAEVRVASGQDDTVTSFSAHEEQVLPQRDC